MLNVLFFIIGFLLCAVITKKPIQIKVHHVHEELNKDTSKDKMREFEKEMFKEDREMDAKYNSFEQNVDEILKEINDTMGGSDR